MYEVQFFSRGNKSQGLVSHQNRSWLVESCESHGRNGVVCGFRWERIVRCEH
jgi:hypothetical protein